MKVSVSLVRSACDKYMRWYMDRNRITFFKKCEGRYEVYQNGVSGNYLDRVLLGVVFRESGVWVFVPDDRKHKFNWHFGLTRVDAICGFLRETDREVSNDA